MPEIFIPAIQKNAGKIRSLTPGLKKNFWRWEITLPDFCFSAILALSLLPPPLCRQGFFSYTQYEKNFEPRIIADGSDSADSYQSVQSGCLRHLAGNFQKGQPQGDCPYDSSRKSVVQVFYCMASLFFKPRKTEDFWKKFPPKNGGSFRETIVTGRLRQPHFPNFMQRTFFSLTP